MRRFPYLIVILIIFTSIYTGCKKPYSPPAIKIDYKFLVVDGTLINSPDSPTVITLSRTVKLTDSTTASFPETGATLSVQGNSGENFPLTEQPGGIYKADHIILSNAAKYRLKINTASGGQYVSDFVEVKQTPEIDSITWQQQGDVSIYANSHDPLNNTKYYRWDFIETWQYRAQLESELAEKNGIIYYCDTNQMYNCWSTANSTNILIGSTIALSNDVVSQAPINIIPQNSERIAIRYSILVKQYAITSDAYQYFAILKTNTENLGSIFDAQPTQLMGNIHSVSNPSEVVIGYFTASSVQQKRIFIDNGQVTGWHYMVPGRTCDTIVYFQNPAGYLIYDYPDPEYWPYYFSGTTGLILVRRTCIDCTLRGGTKIKPSYW